MFMKKYCKIYISYHYYINIIKVVKKLYYYYHLSFKFQNQIKYKNKNLILI